MIRGLIYWFIGSLATLLWGIILFVTSPFSRRRDCFAHKGIRLWALFLLRLLCGVRFDVQGLENLEKGRSYIVSLVGKKIPL